MNIDPGPDDGLHLMDERDREASAQRMARLEAYLADVQAAFCLYRRPRWRDRLFPALERWLSFLPAAAAGLFRRMFHD